VLTVIFASLCTQRERKAGLLALIKIKKYPVGAVELSVKLLIVKYGCQLMLRAFGESGHPLTPPMSSKGHFRLTQRSKLKTYSTT